MSLLDAFIPRWAQYAVCAAIVAGGCYYAGHAIKQSGRDEIQAKWDKAVADAKAVQAQQNNTATVEHAQEQGTAQVVYKTKIQKVVEYVASTQNAGGTVVCPADAQFVGLFNDTGPAR